MWLYEVLAENARASNALELVAERRMLRIPGDKGEKKTPPFGGVFWVGYLRRLRRLPCLKYLPQTWHFFMNINLVS